MADESLKSKQCSSEGFHPTCSLSFCMCVFVRIEKPAGKVIVAYDMANERQRDKKRYTVINDDRIVVEMRMR